MTLQDPQTLVLFAVAALAATMSPGPDTLNVLKHALNGGRGDGFVAVGGVQLGLVGHTVLAAAGVSALIASSPQALGVVAVLGALYLAWLGVQSLRGPGTVRIDAAQRRLPPPAIVREAALVNILNPKVIVLFLALYPNFIQPERGGVAVQLAALSVILIAINTLWQGSLVLGVDAVRRRLADPRTARAVNAVTGLILLGFAVLLLRDHVL
jgi:threonine/homoserine/homoserine lactone efflux protein